MITFACVWVKGHLNYPVEYVINLRAMIRKHFSVDMRFICLTDQPDLLPADVERRVVPTLEAGVFGWWSKVELFNPKHQIGGRIVYLDLDTLVVAPLDDIVNYPSQFALVPDAGTFQPTTHVVVKRYNSSVMVWNAGVGDQLFKKWAPDVAATFWGDQDWVGQLMPFLDRMPLEWFPRLSAVTQNGDFSVPDDARVILCKKPKNIDAAKRWRLFDQIWRA